MSDHREEATLFGSYLENYGDHHEWCIARDRVSEACPCGFTKALLRVAAYHAALRTALEGPSDQKEEA